MSAPLHGFNANVRHHGRTYHVQTEDSGERWGHVITHLFANGGRIVKTSKTSYSDALGDGDRRAIVARVMREQHREMILALRCGELDAALGRPSTPGDEGAATPTPVSAVAPVPSGDDAPASTPTDALEVAAASSRMPVPGRYVRSVPAAIFEPERPLAATLDEALLAFLGDGV